MEGRQSMMIASPLLFLVLTVLVADSIHAFVVPLPFYGPRTTPFLKLLQANKDSNSGEVGSGPNWIERSFPVDVSGSNPESAEELKKVQDYDLGISGVSFQTGPLSKRMFDAMLQNNNVVSEEIKTAFTLYAMDFTAKEATKAALKQNGLQMVLDEDMEDEGLWADVDSIQLLDMNTEEPVGPMYDTTDEAIEHWTPGQGFNFVVRQVPAKIRELSVDELLQALDPEGTLREEAKEKGMTLPDEEITSLQALANDCWRRSQISPRETTGEAEVFSGKEGKRGYTAISRSDLLLDSVNADGTENQKTLMHVMDALVSHGALLVDVTDGGTTYNMATKMAKMWDTIQHFYDALDQDLKLAESLPGMEAAQGTGTTHAKVGYANYKNDSMQFLETRFTRSGEEEILPTEAASILGVEGVKALRDAFDVVAQAGKDVVRIAVAASSMEANAFVGGSDDEEDSPSISGVSFLSGGDDDDDGTAAAVRASQAATKLANELVDDGKPLEASDIDYEEGTVNMSPHRLCRYSFDKENPEDQPESEVFGAHTDSSFATLVPVAAVSGLEVYDEGAERWYRPELAARRQWEKERQARGEDPTADYEIIPGAQEGDDDMKLPWYARYIVVMPGEFLQLATRNEIDAAVHRVVTAKDGPPRLSAPILLRGRSGTKMDVARYLGKSETGAELLSECNGMSFEEIHNAMQPSSFQ